MKQPLHFGVVVGINQYPAISPLQHARRDAERFAAWLRREDGGGLEHDNVVLITAHDEEIKGKPRAQAVPISKQIWDALDPFREAMERAIEEHEAHFKKSRLYFFVSGHGISPASGDAALLMADASPDHYGNNVSCHQLIKFFDLRQYFHELVVFADCCRQPDGECTPGGPPWSRSPRNWGGVKKLWGYATQFHDVALEPTAVVDTAPDDARHGHFTRALLEKLEEDSTDVVDARTLKNYVRRRVAELTDGRQKPEMPVDDNIVLRRGETKPTYDTQIHFPAGFSGDVELCRGLTEVIDRHTTDGNPWTVSLPEELYCVRPVGQPEFRNRGAFGVPAEEDDGVHL